MHLTETKCGYMDLLAQNRSNKVDEFFEQLSDYQLLKRNSASWSWFVRFDTYSFRIECIAYDDN
jgi:LAS superfamily LD-carboxypeptidase LdcB